MATRVAQLLADLGDVDVDGAGVAVPAVAPHAVEDLLAGQRPAPVLGQVAQQLELLAGAVDDPRRAARTSRRPRSITAPPTSMTSAAGADASDAPQDRLHPGHQLPGRERLGEVVVGAHLEAEDPVDLAVPGGEEDDRDAGPTP